MTSADPAVIAGEKQRRGRRLPQNPSLSTTGNGKTTAKNSGRQQRAAAVFRGKQTGERSSDDPHDQIAQLNFIKDLFRQCIAILILRHYGYFRVGGGSSGVWLEVVKTVSV